MKVRIEKWDKRYTIREVEVDNIEETENFYYVTIDGKEFEYAKDSMFESSYRITRL